MVERSLGLVVRYWVLYVALCGLVVLGYILPLGLSQISLPTPDLIYCITIAWLLRREMFVPLVLIAVTFFASDIFFQRPLGLYTLLIVILTELFRFRQAAFREVSFGYEWVFVSGAFFGITILEKIVLLITVSPSIGWKILFSNAIATAIAYPIVVYLSRVLGVYRLSSDGKQSQKVAT